MNVISVLHVRVTEVIMRWRLSGMRNCIEATFSMSRSQVRSIYESTQPSSAKSNANTSKIPRKLLTAVRFGAPVTTALPKRPTI